MAKRKKNKDAGRYRIQASTEAEVARSRLARAREAAEEGNTDKALDLAVESAFDAGVATAFASLAGEAAFEKQVDRILDESQALVRLLVPMEAKAQVRFRKVKNGKQALSKAKGEEGVVQRVYYAGIAHGYGMAKGDAALQSESVKTFTQAYRKQKPAMAANPAPAFLPNPAPSLDARKLKAKLLR